MKQFHRPDPASVTYPMIQSHRPDPASDVRPHGTPPQIDSIAPIQSGAPMTRPCKSTPSP